MRWIFQALPQTSYQMQGLKLMQGPRAGLFQRPGQTLALFRLLMLRPVTRPPHGRYSRMGWRRCLLPGRLLLCCFLRALAGKRKTRRP